LKDPPKFTQIWIFGLKTNHLATLSLLPPGAVALDYVWSLLYLCFSTQIIEKILKTNIKNKYRKQISKTNIENKYQKQISKTNIENKYRKQTLKKYRKKYRKNGIFH
jgi:hypothetical protein